MASGGPLCGLQIWFQASLHRSAGCVLPPPPPPSPPPLPAARVAIMRTLDFRMFWGVSKRSSNLFPYGKRARSPQALEQSSEYPARLSELFHGQDAKSLKCDPAMNTIELQECPSAHAVATNSGANEKGSALLLSQLIDIAL